MYSQFLVNQVPAEWRRRGFASLKPLGSWMKDLRWRVRFFELWLERGNPYAFSLPAFFFPQVCCRNVRNVCLCWNERLPTRFSSSSSIICRNCLTLTVFWSRASQGFLTAVLQNHARKHAVPVNLLGFKYDFPDIMQPEVVFDVVVGVFCGGFTSAGLPLRR